ncbi:MAG: hypothetical protein ACYC91_11335 [Solirubrobacteraceae bacterium]
MSPAMDEQPSSKELEHRQRERERREAQLAQLSPDEAEGAQHERRAEKARYLRERLKERVESEEDAAASEGT